MARPVLQAKLQEQWSSALSTEPTVLLGSVDTFGVVP
jgi:hypothetical protein